MQNFESTLGKKRMIYNFLQISILSNVLCIFFLGAITIY